MGVGAFLEPLVVVSLLVTGTVVNRDQFFGLSSRPSAIDRRPRKRSDSRDGLESGRSSPADPSKALGLSPGPWISSSSTLYDFDEGSERWRSRTLRLWGYRRVVQSPNTKVFEDRFLSRLLRRFPFLVEAWYWALIYWVYQLGRAFTAVTMVKDTVDVAREHALQLIHLEQKLHLFLELSVQKWFLQHPTLMHWTNRLYSFVHIPGTITFLIVLYYLTTTRYRGSGRRSMSPSSGSPSPDRSSSPSSPSRLRFGPHVYEARRRTMAMCNLIAFIVFTLWPCMPPRLLSDPDYDGEYAEEAKGYGFVDTVHGAEGESSVWTTNKFCNQYAAMPSLHFGYSFLIGLTIATLPIKNSRGLSLRRIGIILLGLSYPFMILAAIVSTANHFILDAIAGACVCGIAWWANEFLLNLLVVEDYFLWAVRIHKPVPSETIADESDWRYWALDTEAR